MAYPWYKKWSQNLLAWYMVLWINNLSRAQWAFILPTWYQLVSLGSMQLVDDLVRTVQDIMSGAFAGMAGRLSSAGAINWSFFSMVVSGLSVVLHGSSGLHCSKRQGEEAAIVLRPGTRNWLSAISPICCWSQQSQNFPDLKEGYIEPQPLSGRNVK